MSRRPVRGAARLAAILDALPDALLLVDQRGVIVNANARALAQFETPSSPLVGLNILDVLPEYDPRAGGGGLSGDGQPTAPVRMTALRTDGETFPAEATTCLLPGGYDEELLVLIVRNLAESYDVESELVRQQRQTELILRATTEGIIGVDNDCHIVLVNPAAARILRYRANDLAGKDFCELLHHSRADHTPISPDECSVVDTLRTGRKHRVGDEVLWRRDGYPVHVEMSSAPVREGDSYVGAVLTFSDQSEVKAVSRRNEELVSILDSELRRPLNALYREVSELADDGVGELGPGARRMIRHVLGEFERMTRLVHDVLDYQRFETGNTPLNRQTVELEKILRFAIEASSSLARNGGVDLTSTSTPMSLVVDSDRITQALSHLITDAVASSPAGTTVRVVAERRVNVARIEVQGPVSNRSALHLPIARGIIERHGGFVQALELPGQGTTYVVELPMEPTGRALSAQVAAEATAAQLPAPSTPALTAAPARQSGPAAGDGSEHEAPFAPGAQRSGGTGRLRTAAQSGERGLGGTAGGPSDDEAPAPANGQRTRHAAHARQTAGTTPTIPEQSRMSGEPSRMLPPGRKPEPVEMEDGEEETVARRFSRRLPPVRATDDENDFDPLPTVRRRTARERAADTIRLDPADDDTSVPPSGLGDAGRPTPYVPRRQRAGRTPPRELGSGFRPDDSEETRFTPPPAAAAPQPAPARESAPDAVTRSYQVPDEIRNREGMTAPMGRLSLPPGRGAPPEERPRGRRAAGRHTDSASYSAVDERQEMPASEELPPHGPIYQVYPGDTEYPQEAAYPDDSTYPGEGAYSDDPPPVELSGLPLLVWPEPEKATARALTQQGYVPVTVRTREEVASLAPSSPAALFVDPLTGPITRTALQSLRTAATTANIPVLVTAGLAEATREAAGADPAVLLRALAPVDAPRPTRVLLIEDNQDIAAAFAASLERRGMEVIHAASDNEAVYQASHMTPQIVVSHLLLLRRRRVGVIDWLGDAGLLPTTPIVVYTSVEIDRTNLRQLRANETVLFVAERSTRDDVQQRLVDLLGKLAHT